MAETAKRAARRHTRAQLFNDAYVALVALLFVVVGLNYLLDPDSIGTAFTVPFPYDYAVNGLYLVGGLTILYGVVDRRLGVEVAGHILLVPPMLLSFVFALDQIGLLHRSAILLPIFVIASVLRAIGLVLRWQESP